MVSWAVSGPSASSAILRILIRSTGYSLEEIAHVAGLSPDRLSGASISYGDGLRVWEGVAELVGDPVLGHSVGCGLRLHHVGVFGPLVAHAEDVRQGLLATCRALSLALPEGGLTTSETEDSLTIRYVRPDFPVRVRHGVESLFATLVSLAREASGQRVSPERVSFTSAPPPDRAVFDDYYDAAVEFEAAVDELFFRGPLLAHRMIGDEPALLRVLEERATEVLAASGVEERAIRACRELFDAGREVTLEAAARQLGASARTLQRKLSGGGPLVPAGAGRGRPGHRRGAAAGGPRERGRDRRARRVHEPVGVRARVHPLDRPHPLALASGAVRRRRPDSGPRMRYRRRVTLAR